MKEKDENNTLENNFFEETNDESKKRIEVYISILSGLKLLKIPDVDRLEMIKGKWEEDKTNEKFKFEKKQIEMIENNFAQIVFYYQIQIFKLTGEVNENIVRFCNKDIYLEILKENAIRFAEEKVDGSELKLNMQFLYLNGDVEDFLNNTQFWQNYKTDEHEKSEELTNKTEGSVENQENLAKKQEILAEKQEVSTATENEKINQYPIMELKRKDTFRAIGVLEFNLPFGRIRFKKKLKIDNSGCILYRKKLYKLIRENLIAVSIPEGIEEIREHSFGGYINLKEVYLPESMKIIKDYAFSESGIEKIKISKNMTTISDYAFFRCKKLKEVDMEDSEVSIIGKQAFYNCVNLEQIKFSKNLVEICSRAFSSNRLKKIEFPDSLKVIGENAFEDSSELEKLQFPKKIERVDKKCFENCEKLKKVSFSECYCLTQIDPCTFMGDGNITYLRLPPKLEIIREDAFRGCKKLNYVQIPKSTSFIEKGAFIDCDDLGVLEVYSVKDIGIERNAIANSVTKIRQRKLSTLSEEDSDSFFKKFVSKKADIFK